MARPDGSRSTIDVNGSRTTHPALYRTSQFFAAVKAKLLTWIGARTLPPGAEQAMVSAFLPSFSQQQLFAQMPVNDQRHALAVVRTLRQAGYEQPALMQAALLHDVGKSEGQPIIHRVLIVLFEAFWPAALRRLSASDATAWWRRPFVIHAEHAAIGAAWAKEAGCDPLAVSLIARHQDKLPAEASVAEERLLVVLQWADNSN